MTVAPAWLADHAGLLAALGVVGVVSLMLTMAVLPLLLVRVPADYFRHEHRKHDYVLDRHPLLHHLVVLVKNTLGVVLILAGIAMLVLPGQGLLTIFIGLMLTNFPGKYRLERWLVARPGVLTAINWLRRRAGHEPVLAPLDGADGTEAQRR